MVSQEREEPDRAKPSVCLFCGTAQGLYYAHPRPDSPRAERGEGLTEGRSTGRGSLVDRMCWPPTASLPSWGSALGAPWAERAGLSLPSGAARAPGSTEPPPEEDGHHAGMAVTAGPWGREPTLVAAGRRKVRGQRL